MRQLIAALGLVLFAGFAWADKDMEDLKARISKLEGGQSAQDIAGNYSLTYLQAAIIPDAGVPGLAGTIEHLAAKGNLKLNANGTYSVPITENGFNVLLSKHSMETVKNRQDTDVGTWKYSGNALTLKPASDAADVVSFSGGLGGKLFVTAHANPKDGTTTLILLMRDEGSRKDKSEGREKDD
jgi:hypothetical protein